MTSGLHGEPRLFLRKENKLKNKSDFDFVKENGRRFSNSFYTLLAVSGPEQVPDGVRFGVICSRKFHKRAVVRNRARRIISEAFRLMKPRMTPCRIIVIPRKPIFHATMPEVREKLEQSLMQAGCLMNFPGSVFPSPRRDSC